MKRYTIGTCELTKATDIFESVDGDYVDYSDAQAAIRQAVIVALRHTHTTFTDDTVDYIVAKLKEQK